MLTDQWHKSTRSHTNGCVEVRWHKATASQLNGCIEVAFHKATASGAANCVEIVHNTDEGVVLVRHSRHPGGGVVVFTRQQWQREVLDPIRRAPFYWRRFHPLQFDLAERSAFVQGVMAGEFSLPEPTES